MEYNNEMIKKLHENIRKMRKEVYYLRDGVGKDNLKKLLDEMTDCVKKFEDIILLNDLGVI